MSAEQLKQAGRGERGKDAGVTAVDHGAIGGDVLEVKI
jgi:hypothetical protein